MAQSAAEPPNQPPMETAAFTQASASQTAPASHLAVAQVSQWAHPGEVDAALQQAAEAQVAEEWQVGERILDLYEVRGKLGQGGMGIVYHVYHLEWQMDLAVKSPTRAVLAQMGGKDAFVREAETWVKLGLHPHIVSCYYVRTLGGIPRVFAEYVPGGSLAEWVRDRRLYAGGHQAALARILDVAIQAAWGLAYAHEQGLVHQDVKPANVLLTAEGEAKVTDFGLAKAGSGGVLGPGGIVSPLVSTRGMTPAYCSPEQAMGQPVSFKTDLWSWAVSVLELFVGEVTWPLGTIAPAALEDYLVQESTEDAIPPMPPALADILRQCLQPDAAARPTSFLEIAAALQVLHRQIVGQAYPRPVPQAAQAVADTHNNRALSFMDLGQVEEALSEWEAALRADSAHLLATYNRGLVLWRQGALTDERLVQQLERLPTTGSQDGEARVLLAAIHLERGDVEAAQALLAEASKAAPTESLVAGLLEQMSQMPIGFGTQSRTFTGHRAYVASVCLSTNGRLALSGSDDHTLKLWEVASGRCLRTFQGHTDGVTSVCLSADGRLALSGSADETLKLWEVTSGRCLRTFEGHTKAVFSVCLSADGRLALSGSKDKTLKLWEVASGQCLRTFKGHPDKVLSGHLDDVLSVCLSADGRFALSGSRDHTLKLWEVASGQCLRTFREHASWVRSVCLSADGRFALSGSDDHTLKLWEMASGRCLRTFQGHTDGVTSVCLSADGRLALSGSWDQTLKLWEVDSGRCLRTFEGHTSRVESVCLSADGRLALSGSKDKTLKLWEVPRAFPNISPPRLARLWSHAQLADRAAQANERLQRAMAALQAGDPATALQLMREVRQLPGWERAPQSLEVWNSLAWWCTRVGLRSTWEAGTFTGHTWWVTSVCLSADGRLALSGGGGGLPTRGDYTLKLWEVASGRCLRTFQGHTDGVTSVCLSADGRFALSGSDDHTLKLWEVASGRCLRTFQGHTDGVTSVCLSADGRLALSGSADETLKLWEVDSGHCLRTFEGHTSRVNSVYLSADGRLALSGGPFETLKLWEVASGRCLRTFTGHRAHVTSVCLSADGRFALSGSGDHTLKLWEVDSGRCLRTFQGHTQSVESVCLSADGRLALSGGGVGPLTGGDYTLKLWEVASGRCLRTFEGHTNCVASVYLSADGCLALSGSWDQTLKLWALDWEWKIPTTTG